MDDNTIRQAVQEDLPAILALLGDDEIAQTRTAAAPTSDVEAAFAEILVDDSNELWVIAREGRPVAVLQLTFIPGLSRNGMRRAQVEAVRVRRDLRGRGLGGCLMRHVIDRARERGCGLLQLTTDLRRHDAHRFYEGLGFVASHVGMKLSLAD
jgi:GNAT superfamily N-acetyltransferase